jgi:N,N'-diacetyllegionaminate synthase
MTVEVDKLFDKLLPENGYVIGETACGHEGDIEKLKQLIDCAVYCGVKIIKFQIFIPEERVTKSHPEWDIFNKLFLTEEEWLQASVYAKKHGLIIFSDVFGDAGFSIAEKIGVDGYKIHSEDLLNTYFIEKVAATNKILLIGVGGSHRFEIYELLNHLKKLNLCNFVVLMPGVQTFPTSIDSHSLDEVADLKSKYKSYGVKVGFSDHISGDLDEAITIPLMGFAKGACIVEKHITVNRDDKWEDYESALDRDRFKVFLDQVESLTPLLLPIGVMNQAEKNYRSSFKKTAVCINKLAKGEVIKPEDISYVKKSADKYPLSALQIVGNIAHNGISKGVSIRSDLVESNVGGIIVARCGSSRLPSKALLKIQGRETISLLIERIKRCRKIDKVILATSKDASDDILEEIALREGISVFRGSLNNLSQRFYDAAKYYNLDHIVRITGDDLLRDEVAIDLAIASHLRSSCNVTMMRNMPYGTASEIFSISALKSILDTVECSDNTEYLEYFLENDRYFSVNNYKANYKFNSFIRLTLDYKEDFELFTQIFDTLYVENKKFTLQDVITLFNTNINMINVNKHKTLKYCKDDLDLRLNI